jgi:hypothetical protein
MNRFEILVDGHVQGHDYATRDDADRAASLLRQGNGRQVSIRTKGGTERPPSPVTGEKPAGENVTGHEQGTPGNPAGSPQR